MQFELKKEILDYLAWLQEDPAKRIGCPFTVNSTKLTRLSPRFYPKERAQDLYMPQQPVYSNYLCAIQGCEQEDMNFIFSEGQENQFNSNRNLRE